MTRLLYYPKRKADVSLQLYVDKEKTPCLMLTVQKTQDYLLKPYFYSTGLLGSQLAHTEFLDKKDKQVLVEMFQRFIDEVKCLE